MNLITTDYESPEPCNKFQNDNGVKRYEKPRIFAKSFLRFGGYVVVVLLLLDDINERIF